MASIRAIIFRDSGKWIAQCVDYDILAQADDLAAVRSRLLVAIRAEQQASIEFNGEAFKGIDPAPKFYRELWERASTFRDKSSWDGVTVELALAA